MAEDLVLTAISNLTSLYRDEVNLFQSVNTEREKLQSNLSAIQSVLQDAEKKQLAKKSNALNNWLQKLKDVVFELDDILDDCTTESIRDEYEGDRSCAFLGFLHPHKVLFRHSIIGRMKAVRERLDFIAQEKVQFNLLPAERQPDTNLSNIPQWRLTTSSVTEDEIFGRDQEKRIIVRHLLEDASNADTLYVYPIIGIGGLGKTSLAQLVYADQRITKHFEMKKWICVSENFELNILIKAITESDESPDQLHDMLHGKRYLIVFDDVWNDNPGKWMKLRSLLACGAQGSAVLVTTRLEKVAMMMRSPSVQPYQLSFLSEEDCWKVFRKCAFGSSIVPETQNLVSIGKDIARKCRGVPLAAKTLGGLLMFEADERFWIKIRDSELWTILPEEEDSIFAALRLSYLNLPPRTRRCFSFCSIFPKDHIIKTMDLIHLWMANGLILEEPSTKWELEDIGEMVVNDLYWRSLIQDIDRDDDDSGRISNFKMHDLVHDLAQSISYHESDAMEEPEATYLSPGTRHLSITYFGSELRNISNLLEKIESLRSLVFMSCVDPVDLAISNSLKHTKLRALSYSGVYERVKELPSSIGVLKHLRYLDLYFSSITELPDSIGSLWNLQTLDVSCCMNLKTFPVSIGRLKNLRHLYIEGCRSLSSMPQSMGGLTSLRTLSFVVVGEVKKKEFQLSGFEHLKYLKGKLEIKHLEIVRDVRDVEKANLTEKEGLHELDLKWERVRYGSGDNNDEKQKIQILEALRPPQRLRNLSLDGYDGFSFPDWMMNEISTFTHIQLLKLSNCTRCTQLPPLWRLPSLKHLELFCLFGLRDEADQELNSKNGIIYPQLSKLEIVSCPKLNTFSSVSVPCLRSLGFCGSETVMLSILNSASYNLQSFIFLEDLNISYCDSLESFPDQIFLGLTSLQKLYIGNCSKLKCLPESIKSLTSLVELTISECENLEDVSSFIVQLTSLRNLTLDDLNLKSLDTDTSTDLLALKCLKLEHCFYLESLPNWLTHLASLEILKLWNCSRLTSIPESIQQLSKLQQCIITDCPKLQERYDKETGQDWHKIAHIPHVYIG